MLGTFARPQQQSRRVLQNVKEIRSCTPAKPLKLAPTQPLTATVRDTRLQLICPRRQGVEGGKRCTQHSCRTGFDESDGAVPGADSVQVSFRSDAQGCGHGLLGGLQHLHGPLGLLHVLKVLEK